MGHWLGHAFIGRILVLIGGFTMTISISTGVVIILTGAGLYFAIPVLSR